jgi:Flp pilus assembly protein TadD
MHLNLGLCLFQSGHPEEAKLQYETALQINPGDPRTESNLAWLLAACPQASLRNAGRAVELARHADALTGGENPVILHTLAAAYAEAGRFPEAVEAAEHAARLAEAISNRALASQLQLELTLYRAGKALPSQKPASP